MTRDSSTFKRVLLIGIGGWVLIFAMAPNVALFAVSLATKDPSGTVLPVFTLDSYLRLISPELAGMFFDSLLLAGGATILCLLVGYPFAYLAARAGRDKGQLLLLFVMIPFWTNSLVRTYALIAMLKADGLINSVFMGLGVVDAPLKLLYSYGAVFLGLAYTLLPFMILPLYSAIEKLDPRLLEASRDLGAGRWRTFRSVTLPLTMPGIISGCMLVFLPALGMFYVPDMLGGARHMLLGNFIRDQFLATRNWPMGAAASFGLTLVMGAMLLAYYRSARRVDKEFEA